MIVFGKVHVGEKRSRPFRLLKILWTVWCGPLGLLALYDTMLSKKKNLGKKKEESKQSEMV